MGQREGLGLGLEAGALLDLTECALVRAHDLGRGRVGVRGRDRGRGRIRVRGWVRGRGRGRGEG